ncbi:PilN domain-containing protein [bacterium]|nr:PilN domain-containing protein [bacterium]
MKTKYAIGVSINGTEVRAAFLVLEKGKAIIKALERTSLSEPIEQPAQKEKKLVEAVPSFENAFDAPEPAFMFEGEADEGTDETAENQSVSQIYSLLDRFKTSKYNLAINCPTLTVKYDYMNRESLPKEKKFRKGLKQGIDVWGKEDRDGRCVNRKNISDEKFLLIDYEQNPPIIDLMDEVNQFRAGNMNLVLMDTNELALVDLVNEIYKVKKNEVTAIVYIEEDFSRVIFMKGRQICYITPIIHKGSLSKDVLEVIYSRIIFAQDHHFMPEINKILVAGHSSKLNAKYYFREKFPSAMTAYLYSRKIQSDLRFKDRGLLFSRYAVPIALAWKALQKKVYSSKTHNLLPDHILERQRMPHLAAHGYILLMVLAITAFSFTWLLVAKNIEIRNVTRQVAQLQTQIDNNKALTDRVRSYDDQIIDIQKKIALVDSFSTGYDQATRFLQVLNGKIQETGGIWITQMTKTGSRIHLSGVSERRDKIPVLAHALGGANLKKVTRSEYNDRRVYQFQLDKSIDELDRSGENKAFALLAENKARTEPE